MSGLQPPARSWFRLASIARMEAAEAAAAAATARSTPTPIIRPLPTPPIPRSQQQPTSPPPPPPPLPPPPPPQLPPPPPQPQSPPPLPTSQAEPQPELLITPTPQPEIQTMTTTEIPPLPSPYEPNKPSTPPESPKAIKPSYFSPPHSPAAKQIVTTFNPEPEPEPEPATKPLFQSLSASPEEKTITNSNASSVNNASHSKLQVSPPEKKLRVLTMAGQNIGADMSIGSATPRRNGNQINQAEGNGHQRKMELEDNKKGVKGVAKMKQMMAVVNSNVQGINNSIVLNSTSTQHSPGVHITFASNRKPKESASSSGHKAHQSDLVH